MRGRYKKTQIKQNIWPDALFQMAATSIAAFLCFYSALWMLQDVFPDWKVLPQTHAVAIVLVFVTAIVYEIVIKVIPRFQAVFRLFVPGVYAGAACRFIKSDQIDFEDGACAFVSQYLEKWNRQMKTNFVIWHGKTELISFSFSICFVLALFVVMSLARCLGKRMILLVLPVLALCLTLLSGYAPGGKGIGLLFAAWLFLSACSESDRSANTDVWRLSKKRRRKRGILVAATAQDGRKRFFTKMLRIFMPISAAVFALAIYFASSYFLEVPASGLMEKAVQANQFQKSAEQRISQLASAFITSRNVGINNTAPHYTGREVMKITASQKPASDLYLKGFCATDYENGAWVYNDGVFADACEKNGYQEQSTAEELLNLPYKLFQTSPNEIDKQEIDYTIQYTGLWNRFAYLPYLVDLAALEDEVTFLGDSTIQKNWGRRSIHVRALNHSLGYNVSEFTPQEGITDVSVFYDEFVKDVYRDQFKRPEGFETDNENSVYLQMLQDMVSSNNARIMYAQFVCRMLKRNYEYSLNLDAVPDGEDPIEYFINESGKGYCVHFASAAVYLLRNIGIPARYVSGYHVDAKSFQESEGGYIASVVDRDAHAWAEIYLSNTGWVPIDPTPSARERARQNGQAQAGQETDTETKPEDQETDSQDDQQPEDTQSDQETEDDQKESQDQGAADGNGRKSWLDKVRTVCIFILPFLAFFLAVVLLCRLVHMYRSFPQKEIQKGLYRQAVGRINRRIYRKLRLRGKARRQDMTDAVYEKELKLAYQTVSGQEWAHYIGVTKAAVFSGNGISREDACFCLKIYDRILKWHG